MEEQLASVDDEAICPDESPLDPNDMTMDNYLAEKLRREKTAELVDYRQGQIKRWMAYQYMKDHDINPKDMGEHNPYRALLFKLTKKNYKPPRQKTPVNHWRVAHRDEINAIANRTEHRSKEALAVRDRIARTEFNKLPQEEQEEWIQHAKDCHVAALAQYKRDINGPVSTDPEDRQRCIQGLTCFALPILDLIREATGMVASLIVGGPEPAQQGRLQVISIHSGTTTGAVKMNFGRFERSRYKTYLVPTFGNFLKNCYSPDECRARGLALSSDIEAMIKFDFEGLDVNVDSIDAEPAETPSTSGSSAPSTSGLSSPPTSGPSAPSIPGSSTPSIPGSSAPSIPGSSVPSTSVSSAPSISASATPSASKDARIEDQPRSTTTPSIATEKTADADKEMGADDVLGGQGDGDNGMDITPPPSPMFHSIFDLPLSPIFHEELLPDPNSPAPTETPLLNEIAAPTAIVPPSTTISSRLSPSVAALSLAMTTSLEIATTMPPPTALETRPTLLKRKEPAALVSNSDSSSHASKRPRRGVAVKSGSDAPAAAATKPRKGRKQPSTSARSAPSTGEPSTLPLSSSVDAAWLKSAITMLTAGNLGDRWTNVVNTWVLFERKEINLKPAVLGSAHRPPAVHDWIQRARSALYRPAIASVDRFETSYKLWWASLQPDWRVDASGEVTFAKTSGDWDVIRKPGRNGILSVTAALFFWGIKVKDTEDINGWENAVDDLLLVLIELLR